MAVVVVVVCSSHINWSVTNPASRGHKIDGTKPNQSGNTFGDKQGKADGRTRTDEKVASKGHRRDQQETENANKITN